MNDDDTLNPEPTSTVDREADNYSSNQYNDEELLKPSKKEEQLPLLKKVPTESNSQQINKKENPAISTQPREQSNINHLILTFYNKSIINFNQILIPESDNRLVINQIQPQQ